MTTLGRTWPGWMLVALACSTDAEANRQAQEETPNAAGSGDAEAAATYTVVDVADRGSITGTLRFTGDVPGPRTVHVTEDVETCGTTQQVQHLAIHAQRGVANAVVSLIDIKQGAAIEAPELPPTLDQTVCCSRSSAPSGSSTSQSSGCAI